MAATQVPTRPRLTGIVVLGREDWRVVDLVACREALRQRTAKKPGANPIRELASAADCSMVTVARFLSGSGKSSLGTARAIVAALGLDLAAISAPCERPMR